MKKVGLFLLLVSICFADRVVTGEYSTPYPGECVELELLYQREHDDIERDLEVVDVDVDGAEDVINTYKPVLQHSSQRAKIAKIEVCIDENATENYKVDVDIDIKYWYPGKDDPEKDSFSGSATINVILDEKKIDIVKEFIGILTYDQNAIVSFDVVEDADFDVVTTNDDEQVEIQISNESISQILVELEEALRDGIDLEKKSAKDISIFYDREKRALKFVINRNIQMRRTYYVKIKSGTSEEQLAKITVRHDPLTSILPHLILQSTVKSKIYDSKGQKLNPEASGIYIFGNELHYIY